jgi:hypothetical protein
LWKNSTVKKLGMGTLSKKNKVSPSIQGKQVPIFRKKLLFATHFSVSPLFW